MTKLKDLLPNHDEIWVRISLISFCSILTIFFTALFEPLIPEGLADIIGAGSVEDLLKIIANSMLAVTTFSLTVMVSVFRSASSQWTPRIHPLMMKDKTTQNTLATFIGAYVYSVSCIIMLRTNLYEAGNNVVLFCFTIFILILIVVAIIKWVSLLQKLGSLVHASRRVEHHAQQALKDRMENPYLGANALASPDDMPAGCIAVTAEKSGYLKAIDASEIASAAERAQIDVYFPVPIGDFVFEGDPIAYQSASNDDLSDAVVAGVKVGDVRDVDHDPRFGFVILGEIGSRALSPGINDPGTAIDVITRSGRLLRSVQAHEFSPPQQVDHARLWVLGLDPADFLTDCFDSIGRDGKDLIEVQHSLQLVLQGLARHGDGTLAKAAKAEADAALERAKANLTNDRDVQRLESVAR